MLVDFVLYDKKKVECKETKGISFLLKIYKRLLMEESRFIKKNSRKDDEIVGDNESRQETISP